MKVSFVAFPVKGHGNHTFKTRQKKRIRSTRQAKDDAIPNSKPPLDKPGLLRSPRSFVRLPFPASGTALRQMSVYVPYFQGRTL